jgi:RNA polymerase sigma-70 factor (ECF subfamily)
MTKSTTQSDDAELIAQACGGSHTAFEALTKRYYNTVLARFEKRHVSLDIAKDLAQQTFINIYEHLSSYAASRSAFSTWVHTIANNIYIDYKRRQKNDNTIAIDENFNEIDMQIDMQPNPEESMIAEQEKAEVLQLLSRLKPHYRRVIELRYIDKYAYEEIAEELQLPMGTVKTHLYRAKEQLMTVIANRV